MMYDFLMMAMTLLGGIVRLAQVLRLSVPLLYGALVITVFRVVSGPYRSGGRHFPCAGGACGTFLGGGADSSSAGDDLVSKVCTWRNALE